MLLGCPFYIIPVELGINFSHIRVKSMTVLNPLQHVDEHIMDDADLAGPLLFFFLFGMLLLLVNGFFFRWYDQFRLQNPIVRKTTVWLHLRFRLVGVGVDIHPPQSHVRQRHRRLPRRVSFGLLSTPNGWCRCSKRSCHS